MEVKKIILTDDIRNDNYYLLLTNEQILFYDWLCSKQLLEGTHITNLESCDLFEKIE